MEKIRKLNLDIALFVKELNLFIENVKEIDDETIKLLTEAIIAVNKLQINSKFRESLPSNNNYFALDLNDEVFELRRYIVCRLCHENISLSSEDFELHIQKWSHRNQAINTKPIHVNENSSPLNAKTILKRKPNASIDTSGFNGFTTSLESPTPMRFVDTNGSKNKSSPIIVNVPNVITPIPIVSQKLEDVINIMHISQALPIEMIDITSRSIARIQYEQQIVATLTRYLKKCDSNLKLVPIGSATYGFGGSETNFNILFITNQNPTVMLNSLEKQVKSSGAPEFKEIVTIDCNRLQKRRLQAIHKESKIVCSMQFSRSYEMAESSQIIRNAIVHAPICFHVIAFIRSWQNVLERAAAKKGIPSFQFNSYIISVLVISFLQVNKNFPKLKDLPATQLKCINHVETIDQIELKQAVSEFFEFYGKRYVSNYHLISLNIGRWQERNLPSQQTALTPEQKSLREGISLNMFNWENCSMFVQDIKSPGMNITVDISKENAINFKTMCKMFFSSDLHEKPIEEYMSKLTQIDTATLNGSHSSVHSVATRNRATDTLSCSSLSSLQSLKTAISSLEDLNSSQSSNTNSSVNVNMNASPKPTPNKVLIDIVDVEETSELINSEMEQILMRSADRIKSEYEIIDMLSNFLESRNSIETLVPFGSVALGFGGPNTNLNILAVTDISESTSDSVQNSFENSMKTSILQLDLEYDGLVGANRVQNERIKIIHKTSQIRCLLEFGTESALKHTERTKRIIHSHLYKIVQHFVLVVITSWSTNTLQIPNVCIAKNILRYFNVIYLRILS